MRPRASENRNHPERRRARRLGRILGGIMITHTFQFGRGGKAALQKTRGGSPQGPSGSSAHPTKPPASRQSLTPSDETVTGKQPAATADLSTPRFLIRMRGNALKTIRRTSPLRHYLDFEIVCDNEADTYTSRAEAGR